MQYSWDWLTGFWLADGCISTSHSKPTQYQIRLFQNSERLIDEMQKWLESKGFHTSKYFKSDQKRHVILSIHRHKEVLKLAKILVKRTPKWHYKTRSLRQAIKALSERIRINQPHIERGERDELGRFTHGHKYTSYSLEGREKEFAKLYLDKKVPLRELSQNLGIGYTTIYRMKRRLNLPPRLKAKPMRRTTLSECRKIGEFYNSNLPIKEIEQRTGRRRSEIYRILRRSGIQPNRGLSTQFKKGNYPARWLKRKLP